VVTSQGKDRPATIVLGAAGPRPLALDITAKQLADRASSEEQLRAAIAADLAAHFRGPDSLDAYQIRMHRANILRAIGDMRRQ
jgi:CO/xanthine dehydrogenase FAD-binding subunit